MNKVIFPVQVVCNIASRELIKFFYGKQIEEVIVWYKEKKDLSMLLPICFTIPDGIKGKVTRAVLNNLLVRINNNYPAYDLILQNIYNAISCMNQYEKKEDIAKMHEIQIIAAFLGNAKIKPWYYENMNRVCEKIILKLGDGNG